MKRLILCCDGTWQDSDGGVIEDPTNITRIVRALKSQAADGTHQIVYYQSGVGTGGTVDRLVGGGTGQGLSEHVREGYGFISHNYHPGDTIHLFGFSRGAYTARSICGLICRLGVLTKRGMDDFYNIYQAYISGRLRDQAYLDELQTREKGALVIPNVEVTTIGCFDTVGSLGIPTLPIPFFGRALSGVVNAKKYLFHDTDLSPKVLHAFHALALDEKRAPFTPALWYKAPDNTTTELRQCWFPGVHTNVGGGYPDQEIADMTLAWMIERTKDFLDWDYSYLRCIYKNGGNRREWAEGMIYNSRTGMMKLSGMARRTPKGYHEEKGDTGEFMHVSVRVRRTVCPEWKCKALDGWSWNSQQKAWVASKDPSKVVKEDWLGDTEMELAGKEVVEKLLGWAFPGDIDATNDPDSVVG
ncbi:Similar to Uncharacterized protein YEL023C; acc. no. P39992 [Pyronema omphalodes CBS 100304]|uniref:Similar to Uncharacterized protein YEL023C acc. no. P39992 n=1 Tax=Pyronema omphalodes (strain CBS 100304) TaxID=1076935 RepID=U4LMB4_PYROM|nr:Similar to Uncharacterized protein YEL023C; acc. no. P39992 [Pyronema omphalodes CBS 100304]